MFIANEWELEDFVCVKVKDTCSHTFVGIDFDEVFEEIGKVVGVYLADAGVVTASDFLVQSLHVPRPKGRLQVNEFI